MASEYMYFLTQKAEADLDSIVSYLSLELANAKAASDTAVRKKVIGNYLMYYLPDTEQHIIYILRLIYGRRSVEEILRQLEI